MDHFYSEAMRLAEVLKQGRMEELPKGIAQDGSIDPWLAVLMSMWLCHVLLVLVGNML